MSEKSPSFPFFSIFPHFHIDFRRTEDYNAFLKPSDFWEGSNQMSSGQSVKKAKKQYDPSNLCEGPLIPQIIRFTIPVILSGILQLLFNAADLVVVGRFCGSVSVAAVGATGSIINLIVNLFIGLSVGAGVSVAQSIGAQQDEETHRLVHTAIPTAFIGGAVLTVVGVCGAGTFLTWMETPPDVLPLSTVYMKIYFCGIASSMLYNFGSAILRAAGDTKRPLYYLTIAGILNVVLNVFFVVVFHLDVAGVALATAISQTLSAVLVLIALTRRTDSCKLSFRKMHFSFRPLLKMMRIGIPAGIQSSLFSFSNVIIQSSVNSFGSVVMSGNAAAGNIEGFVYIALNSLQQTSMNFTGQNVGAGNYKRVGQVMRICLLFVTGIGIVFGSLVYIFARPLLSIYITDSAQAIEYGIIRMTFVCLPYFLCGLMDVMTGTLRGMGVSLAPMLITVIGACGFRILWIFTVFQIPEYHSPQSLYISYPISWTLTFLAELVCYLLLSRRRKKHLAFKIQ